MRALKWLLGGVVLGFIAAHLVNQNPEGRRFFERLNRGAEEFGRAFAAGYHEGEAIADPRGNAGAPGVDEPGTK